MATIWINGRAIEGAVYGGSDTITPTKSVSLQWCSTCGEGPCLHQEPAILDPTGYEDRRAARDWASMMLGHRRTKGG